VLLLLVEEIRVYVELSQDLGWIIICRLDIPLSAG
jgi:hypothetical protein